MKAILKTSGHFSSAHHLEGYEGNCANVHGHTWAVKVEVRGDTANLDKIGMLIDFKKIKKLIDKLDHKDLNKVLVSNPTAENIAIYLYENLAEIDKTLEFNVEVFESPESSFKVGDFI